MRYSDGMSNAAKSARRSSFVASSVSGAALSALLSSCAPPVDYECVKMDKVSEQVCVESHQENVTTTGNNLERALVGMSEYVTVCDREETRVVDGCVEWKKK
jgi:ATP:corrinoid adenosyltransferase